MRYVEVDLRVIESHTNYEDECGRSHLHRFPVWVKFLNEPRTDSRVHFCAVL